LLATERHTQGREHLATVLNWWLLRCGFTHAQVTALAAWVCGDHTWLQGSQLSHLRNGRMRTPQLKLMEGLAAVNQAVALWQLEGKKACLKRWGPPPAEAPSPELMDAATFLWHPQGGEQQPLVFHDFCDLFVGYLTLLYVDAGSVSPSQARLISERIGQELDRWIAAQGGIRAGLAKLISIYPADDAARVAKLQNVILGLDSYTAAELDLEMLALAELFAELWQRPVDPQKLFAELAAAPH
jgi:hypothetical protein